MLPVNVLTLILAGGTGTRLRPLTLRRCKPAVPFGGDFRVIDFTLMSCVSSGVGAIYVLTQHRSEILESHFNGRWKSFSSARNSCATSLTTLPPKKGEAYVGTADAVYKNLELLKLRDAVLVLSGDHVYHANYQKLISAHLDRNADVTLLTGEVPAGEAASFGVLQVSEEGRITRFVEKPTDPRPYARRGKCSINLGVYCFRPQFLVEQLLTDARNEGSSHDFGRDILPMSLDLGVVASCPLGMVSPGGKPYWRDVGTLDSFFEANMDLLRSPEVFDLADSRWPSTSPFRKWVPRRLRVTARSNGRLVRGQNLVSEDVEIESSRVLNCVISPGVRIGKGSELIECVLFPGAQIGSGVRLRRVIVEEGTQVPSGTEIGCDPSSQQITTSSRGVYVYSASRRSASADLHARHWLPGRKSSSTAALEGGSCENS